MMDSVASGECSGRSKDTSTFSWKTSFKSLLESWSGVRIREQAHLHSGEEDGAELPPRAPPRLRTPC